MVNVAGQKVYARTLSITQADQIETIQRMQTMNAGMYWLNIYNISTNQRMGTKGLIIAGD